nr:hypothetical protein [Tanacetum cinerariifolium]
MDKKKHIVNLESFREMLHICPRLPHQPFIEPPFEEEILAFLWFLGHSGAIRRLTNMNINKLQQPWRSFAAIGLYHKRNVDFAYLMREDFVYQVEHKDIKKSNEMYYHQFTKVIIHHFMSNDSFIPRRNKVNWHYVRDNHMFSMIKWVSKHQNMQQFGALLPIQLTNEDIRNSNAYKEYYAVATGATSPKPKASVRKTRGSSDTTITPPTAVASQRLTTFEKGKQALKLPTKRSLQQTHISQASGSGADERTGSIPGVPDIPTDESKEKISWNSTNEEGDDDEGNNGGDDGEEEEDDDDDDDDEQDDDEENNGEEGNDEDDDQEDDRDDNEDDEEKGNVHKQASDEEEFIYPNLSTHAEEKTRDMESFDPIPKTPKNGDDEGNGEENLETNVGREEGHDEEEKEDELNRDVNINQGRGIQTTQEFEDSHVILTPVNLDGQQQSSSVSSQFRMNEAVKVAVQIQSDRLCDEAQVEKDEFLKTIDENMQKIIKEKVKEQVKVQVSKILPKIEQTVNEQLEAKVLTRSSNSLKISYDVSADLSEMELKKIFIKKIDGNKSIHRSNEQRNLYKALVEAYESDKIILDTYRDKVTLKRRRDDDPYKDEEPFAGSDWGSKRRREGKEPESASAPMEKATRSPGQQYPHNLLKPLPLISKNRGRRVIPFEHFINNDLEYLRGGASSRKYTTFVTKTKAADYGHIKWIEDFMPRTMWIQEPIGYDQHALWGISYWGRKRQQFYVFAVNRESTRDVYSKRKIIAVTKLKIVEMLTDVRTALDDRLKGIRMKYLPQSIWRKSDKDRAAVMIQAIDKRLKTRRIMRSLEMFVRGRLYEGDFKMLQRTI